VRKKHVDSLVALIKVSVEWHPLKEDGEKLVLAILHRPDQVAGGYDRFEKFEPPPEGEKSPDWQKYLAKLKKMFGPADVNSNIGREWSKRIKSVVEDVKQKVVTHEAQPIHKLNLKISVAGGA